MLDNQTFYIEVTMVVAGHLLLLILCQWYNCRYSDTRMKKIFLILSVIAFIKSSVAQSSVNWDNIISSTPSYA